MKVDLFKAFTSPELISAAVNVLNSGQIAYGDKILEFERNLSRLLDIQSITTTSDMSTAIQIAFRIIGIDQDSEIITSPFACMSTNAPIGFMNAKPVWCDVENETGFMNPKLIEKLITKRTKALILYHLAGYPGYISEILEICSRNNIALIEDCDNALMSVYGKSLVGTFGNFSIYSFYPNRQINCTEGGAISCMDIKDDKKAKLLRRYGIDIPNFRDEFGEIKDVDIPEIGYSATLNNLCSHIGLTQIDSVNEKIARTRRNASILSKELSGLAFLKLVEPLPNTLPSYWVLLATSPVRDALLHFLKSKGVGCSKLHYLNNKYSCFNSERTPLPGAEKFMEGVIALPCGWWLNDNDLDFIINTIKSFNL